MDLVRLGSRLSSSIWKNLGVNGRAIAKSTLLDPVKHAKEISGVERVLRNGKSIALKRVLKKSIGATEDSTYVLTAVVSLNGT